MTLKKLPLRRKSRHLGKVMAAFRCTYVIRIGKAHRNNAYVSSVTLKNCHQINAYVIKYKTFSNKYVTLKKFSAK